MYKALASEARQSEGLNAHALIIDELHAWTGAAGRAFYDSLKYAGRARRQPLTFVITTAGDDMLSVCYDLHNYARGVVGGQIEDSRFFAYIRNAEPNDNFDDKAVWAKANPSMGDTIGEEDFAADLREARKTPAAWATFLRYSFNVWTSGASPAIDIADWRACKEEFTEEDLFGRQCWAALDLSRAKDFTALSLVFRDEDGTYRVLCYFWLPAESATGGAYGSMIREWNKAGHIHLTDGNVTDYRVVCADIVDVFRKFNVQELAFDPYFAEEVTQEIADKACVERVAFGQTVPNYAAPCAEFERIVVGKQLRHDGNPVLDWNVGNLQWRIDSAGNRRPVKPAKDSPKRIDGAVATIMAVGRCMLVPLDAEPEVSFV